MSERELVLRHAGGLVKHLGLQMYTSPTRAIAELISNAWDGEAGNVHVKIPLGQDFSDASIIEITDDGIGMTFEECRDEYLIVGRDRRREEGEFSKNNKRRIQAHKGLGKLAGFGIANLIEVRTVKNKWLTNFSMDYDKIEKAKLAGDCKLDIIDDRNINEKDGTKIILKKIKLNRAIAKDRFFTSMARRFSIFSNEFKVFINGEQLEKKEMPLEFRFPEGESNWNSETIPGCGEIKWWIGFTKDPIKDEVSQGISVLSRGKIAQEPWFFQLTGGLWAQHGKEYMTGEVIVDEIDGVEDLISTDRSTVRWSHPKLMALVAWGQQKIKELIREWARRRSEKKLAALKEKIRYAEIIEKYQPREQAEIKFVFEKLASSPTLGDDKIYKISLSFLKAFQNEHVMSLIREMDAMEPDDQEEIWNLISEYDILEAIDTFQKLKARRDIIKKLSEMIERGAAERPDMQDFIKKHRWIIEPRFEYMRPETSLDKLLIEEFKLSPTKSRDGKKIPDFFCLGGLKSIIIVELKRPGRAVPRDELDRARDYVFFLREWAKKTDDPNFQYSDVSGRVILSKFGNDVTSEHQENYKSGGLHFIEWKRLSIAAEQAFDFLFNMVKEIVPEDDPRIKAIEDPDYLRSMLQKEGKKKP
jgi:hypothetical protein